MTSDAHVVEELHEYALDILSTERSETVREHLQSCRHCLQELRVVSDLIVQSFEAEISPTPPNDLRSRLLQEVSSIAPYSLYHPQMVAMLHGTAEGLRKELMSMPHPNTWAEGPVPRCRLFPCVAAGAPRDAIRNLVLMEGGSHFPTHEHLGEEAVLILQGSMQTEDGKVHRPGDALHMAAGTSHAFDVPRGLDLIYLVTVDQGLCIGDQRITAATLGSAATQGLHLV